MGYEVLSSRMDKLVRNTILKRIGKGEWNGGWLTPFFNDTFHKVWIGPGNISSIVHALICYRKRLSFHRLIVIPNATWRAFTKALKGKAIRVEADQLGCFLKDIYESGTTDYYIMSDDLKLKWIVAICHEGELHIAGPPSLVRLLVSGLRASKA